MANKNIPAPETAAVRETAQDVAQESVYTAQELALHAEKLFGHNRDIAAAALDYEHVTSCTINRAKAIIKAFAERKVN